MVLHFATAVALAGSPSVLHSPTWHQHEGNVRTCGQQVLQERLAIGTVTRGKRTGKRRLSAKSQPLRGRILLRADTNTQEGDCPFSSASKDAGGLAVPRFDLQPFSRGVDLHSWTRLRGVPGGRLSSLTVNPLAVR